MVLRPKIMRRANLIMVFQVPQTNLVINYDRSKSEIRFEQSKIAIEINKSRKLLIDGKVESLFWSESK